MDGCRGGFGRADNGGCRGIVRVGTHTGVNQLRSRLQQHFVKENKDRSIFRKNIGRALLNRAGDPFLAQWDTNLTTRRARETVGLAIDRRRLAEVEALVSAYSQGHLSFVVLRVDDRTERLTLESRLISIVSRCEACRPSANWLGLHSPKTKIRAGGLLLVNELWKEPLSPADLARVGGALAYAPGLPFIERLLPSVRYRVVTRPVPMPRHLELPGRASSAVARSAFTATRVIRLA